MKKIFAQRESDIHMFRQVSNEVKQKMVDEINAFRDKVADIEKECNVRIILEAHPSDDVTPTIKIDPHSLRVSSIGINYTPPF